jgi:predicted transcriptional regulator of viral defense system
LEELSLFPDMQFNVLRQKTAGKPMAVTLIDCLEHAVYSGLSGINALNKAVTSVVVDKTNRAMAQIREHYTRKSKVSLSNDVIDRLSRGLQEIGFEKLAQKFLSFDSQPFPKHSKRTGLDDGVII